MNNTHFLEKAHENMKNARLGHLWTPGSTTWRHFSEVSENTIKRAQRDGYLSVHTGIPYLTSEGYTRF